jgi:hypothetical protein
VQGKQPDSKHYKEVLLPDIHKNNNSLNVHLYTYKDEVIELPSLEEELGRLAEAKQGFQAAQTRLDELLAHPLLKEQQ